MNCSYIRAINRVRSPVCLLYFWAFQNLVHRQTCYMVVIRLTATAMAGERFNSSTEVKTYPLWRRRRGRTTYLHTPWRVLYADGSPGALGARSIFCIPWCGKFRLPLVSSDSCQKYTRRGFPTLSRGVSPTGWSIVPTGAIADGRTLLFFLREIAQVGFSCPIDHNPCLVRPFSTS